VYPAGDVECLSGALVVCLVSALLGYYGDLVVVTTLGTDTKLPIVITISLNCCYSTAGFITLEYHGPRRYN